MEATNMEISTTIKNDDSKTTSTESLNSSHLNITLESRAKPENHHYVRSISIIIVILIILITILVVSGLFLHLYVSRTKQTHMYPPESGIELFEEIQCK